MNVRVERCESVKGGWWDDLVARAPEGSIFQTAEWAEYMRDYYHYEPLFLVAVDGGGTPVGCLLAFRGAYCHEWLFRRPLGPLATRVVGRLLPSYHWLYGPIVMPEQRDRWPEIAQALVDRVRTLNVESGGMGIELGAVPIHSPAGVPVLPLPAGWAAKKGATLLLDLAPDTEQIWAAFRNSARKAIRRAEAQGVRVEVLETFEALRDYHAFAQEATRARRELPFPGPFRHYETIWNRLGQPGFVKFFVAKRGEELLSGLGVRVFNGIISEFNAVQSARSHAEKVYGNDLIKWEIIRWGKATGCRLFDLAGVVPEPATGKERAIRQFKEKWSGRLVEYEFLSRKEMHGRAALVRAAVRRWRGRDA